MRADALQPAQLDSPDLKVGGWLGLSTARRHPCSSTIAAAASCHQLNPGCCPTDHCKATLVPRGSAGGGRGRRHRLLHARHPGGGGGPHQHHPHRPVAATAGQGARQAGPGGGDHSGGALLCCAVPRCACCAALCCARLGCRRGSRAGCGAGADGTPVPCCAVSLPSSLRHRNPPHPTLRPTLAPPAPTPRRATPRTCPSPPTPTTATSPPAASSTGPSRSGWVGAGAACSRGGGGRGCDGSALGWMERLRGASGPAGQRRGCDADRRLTRHLAPALICAPPRAPMLRRASARRTAC